jgi:hypothetical protein
VLANQAHDVEGADLRRACPVLERDVGAHHALELQRAVPNGNNAGGVEQLADLFDWNVGGKRLGRFGKLQAKRQQVSLGGFQAQGPSGASGEQA